MNKETILEINYILENINDNEEVQRKLNFIFNKPKNETFLDLHSNLSITSLKRIYSIIDKLNLEDASKEHIIWLYYKKTYQDPKDMICNEQLQQIIDDYKKYPYAASGLESVLVAMIKSRKLNLNQISSLKESIGEKEIQKEALIYANEKLIADNQKLNKDNVKELIDNEAFDFLIKAIEIKMIEDNTLDLFKSPEHGEKYKKKKVLLYELAQKIKQ